MNKVNIGKAMEWMMSGKPVKMELWPDNEYIRFSELNEHFVMHVDGESYELGELIVPADVFLEQDWVLGTWMPDSDTPCWVVE